MKKGPIVIALIVLVVLGGIAWYLYGVKQAREAAPSPLVETAPQVMPQPEPEPEPPPVVEEKRIPMPPMLEELPLPPLNESDDYAGGLLSGLVGEAAAIQYFAPDGLVSRAVATVDALGSRQVPGNIQAMAGPGDGFTAIPDPAPTTVIRNEFGDPVPQYLSDPAGHERYLHHVEMLLAVEAEQFAGLYRRNYPLLQAAWRELGYTDISFEERLIEVLDELIATPEVEEPYRLIKPEAVYLFADERLEALSAGQKMLLRMGSENAARVKSRLTEFRQAID